tara:strand:- start:2141 stop:2296 length:156 start_codon:yes stop_codon:yes gene_type:complete
MKNPSRKDMNYNRPPNKLRKFRPLAKSSPKKYMGLKLTRMYGQVKPKKVIK